MSETHNLFPEIRHSPGGAENRIPPAQGVAAGWGGGQSTGPRLGPPPPWPAWISLEMPVSGPPLGWTGLSGVGT